MWSSISGPADDCMAGGNHRISAVLAVYFVFFPPHSSLIVKRNWITHHSVCWIGQINLCSCSLKTYYLFLFCNFSKRHKSKLLHAVIKLTPHPLPAQWCVTACSVIKNKMLMTRNNLELGWVSRASPQRFHAYWWHLYNIFEMTKISELGNRLVVTRGQGWWGGVRRCGY